MEILSTQLRIGNSILVNNVIIPKIGYGVITDVYQKEKGIKNNYLDTLDFKPIPLSEEMLLTCGFEKIPHFTVMNSLIYKLGRDRQLSIGCVGTPNEMLFITEVDDEDNPTKVDDLICLHNFDYDGKLYLHNLQNIVAVFGQELNTSGLC